MLNQGVTKSGAGCGSAKQRFVIGVHKTYNDIMRHTLALTLLYLMIGLQMIAADIEYMTHTRVRCEDTHTGCKTMSKWPGACTASDEEGTIRRATLRNFIVITCMKSCGVCASLGVQPDQYQRTKTRGFDALYGKGGSMVNKNNHGWPVLEAMAYKLLQNDHTFNDWLPEHQGLKKQKELIHKLNPEALGPKSNWAAELNTIPQHLSTIESFTSAKALQVLIVLNHHVTGVSATAARIREGKRVQTWVSHPQYQDGQLLDGSTVVHLSKEDMAAGLESVHQEKATLALLDIIGVAGRSLDTDGMKKRDTPMEFKELRPKENYERCAQAVKESLARARRRFLSDLRHQLSIAVASYPIKQQSKMLDKVERVYMELGDDEDEPSEPPSFFHSSPFLLLRQMMKLGLHPMREECLAVIEEAAVTARREMKGEMKVEQVAVEKAAAAQVAEEASWSWSWWWMLPGSIICAWLSLRTKKQKKVKICHGCGNGFPKLKRCEGCNQPLYCSKQCQRDHRAEHKATCDRVAGRVDMSGEVD